jgi:hypothetical protein
MPRGRRVPASGSIARQGPGLLYAPEFYASNENAPYDISREQAWLRQTTASYSISDYFFVFFGISNCCNHA